MLSKILLTISYGIAFVILLIVDSFYEGEKYEYFLILTYSYLLSPVLSFRYSINILSCDEQSAQGTFSSSFYILIFIGLFLFSISKIIDNNLYTIVVINAFNLEAFFIFTQIFTRQNKILKIGILRVVRYLVELGLLILILIGQFPSQYMYSAMIIGGFVQLAASGLLLGSFISNVNFTTSKLYNALRETLTAFPASNIDYILLFVFSYLVDEKIFVALSIIVRFYSAPVQFIQLIFGFQYRSDLIHEINRNVFLLSKSYFPKILTVSIILYGAITLSLYTYDANIIKVIKGSFFFLLLFYLIRSNVIVYTGMVYIYSLYTENVIFYYVTISVMVCTLYLGSLFSWVVGLNILCLSGSFCYIWYVRWLFQSRLGKNE